MQLCRFVLRDQPQPARSGIFHDGRMFETDGEKALGVHELSKIVLLPPVPHVNSVRVFDSERDYCYRNPAPLYGPLADIEIAQPFHAEIRVCVLLKEGGMCLEGTVAHEAILGYTVGIFLVDPGADSPTARCEAPFAIGPFLTMPEDGRWTATFEETFTIKKEGVLIGEEPLRHAPFASFIAAASQRVAVLPSELIAGPALEALSPDVRPGDTLQVGGATLGMLTVRFC